jgi:hypothetical protein
LTQRASGGKQRKNIKPSHDTLKDPQTPCNPPPQNHEDKEAVKMTIPRNKHKGKETKRQVPIWQKKSTS